MQPTCCWAPAVKQNIIRSDPMTNSSIASYAIIQVNWEQPNRRDYLDNFVLIVAEAIRQLPHDPITLVDVQSQIRNAFGFNLPQNTIKSLLNRVKRRGYIEESYDTYKRNDRALANLNFREIQQQVLQAHEALIEGLAGFALGSYDVTWLPEQAEVALDLYLQENQVRLLSDPFTSNPNEAAGSPASSQKEQFVVAKYIQHLQETQSSKLEYLERVIKGNLLANAVFLTDPSTYQRKFRDTTVFFDAPLVVYALGYTGEPRKWPVIELIDLLKAHGAHLAIFRHSYEEIIGILAACAERVRQKQFRDSYGPSIEYFISKGYSETDVMMFIEKLDSNLVKLGLTVSDKPPYKEHAHVIDEAAFSKYLRGQVGYQKDLSLERDKDSIAAIVRLRRGETHIAIEECRAIFVTANRHLACCSRQYEGFNYQPGTAPLGITDYELTNLVWLKDPAIAPELPRKRIIADCYAATQPSERLWVKYLEAIDRLERQSKITSDDYFLLRHSIQAKSELMERTLGDETAFAEGTVAEILSSIQERLHAEDVARANAEALAKQEALIQLEREREERRKVEDRQRLETEDRRRKIRDRATKIARRIVKLVTVSMILVVGYFTYATSPIGPLSIDPNNQLTNTLKNVALVVFWILLILQTLNLTVGFMPKKLLDRFEDRIADWVEKLLVVE